MNSCALHARADGAEAVKVLLRALRRALATGELEVDIPVVLVGRTPPRAQAGVMARIGFFMPAPLRESPGVAFDLPGPTAIALSGHHG
jgi:hypothetical protein